MEGMRTSGPGQRWTLLTAAVLVLAMAEANAAPPAEVLPLPDRPGPPPIPEASQPLPGERWGVSSSTTGAVMRPAPPPNLAAARVGDPLVPGQMIQPIDLPGALRLAGARDLDIAIARERVA